MNVSFLQFINSHAVDLFQKLQEQIYLVSISVLIAVLIGIPLGIFVSRFPKFKSSVLNISAVLWTIPSLALLAFLIPILGIGVKPAIVVLTLYALLPIIRGTVTGIEGLPEDTIEAARGLGFTKFQRLRMVELPLAMPVIVNGVRTAAIISVGIATLAAFIGAGGLGDFINRGLAMNNSAMILLGAIPAAILALSLDFSIGRLEDYLAIPKQRRVKKTSHKVLVASLAIILLLPLWLQALNYFHSHSADKRVVVASKNFTEQFILAEMISQLLQNKTDLQVVKKLDLGTTAICQHAMQTGEIDIYPEYTGTAYLTVLKQSYNNMPSKKLFSKVKNAYKNKYNIEWLKPFGFENSQGLAVRKDLAIKYHLKTISDLASLANKLKVGAPAEFIIRPDAMPGLQRAYHLKFKNINSLDPGLMYKAIANKDVDVIMAFTTDGRISAYNLVVLKDDKHFFPPYDASLLARNQILKMHPEIKIILNPLFGNLNQKDMQNLNYLVDMRHENPEKVAHDFLKQKHLL